MKKILIYILVTICIYIFCVRPCANNLQCVDYFSNYIQYPFIWLPVFIAIGLLSFAVKVEKRLTWLKFTGSFFLVSMFLVYMMPEYGTGIVSIDRELTNRFLVGVYSITSVVYFAVQFLKNRRLGNK